MKRNRARMMLLAAAFAASSFWARQARAARTDFNGGSFGNPDGKDDLVWLRTDRDADWLRNLDSDARCRIRVGGIEGAARREPVPDEAAALRGLVDLWRAKYGAEWVSDWYVERGRTPVRLRLER